MSDFEAINAFMDSYRFPDAARVDSDPRIWFQVVDGEELVFQLAPGETEDDPELIAIAEAALQALVAAHPELTGYKVRVDEDWS
jgi:hypothetical protein